MAIVAVTPLHQFSKPNLQLHVDENSLQDVTVASIITPEGEDELGYTRGFEGQGVDSPPPIAGFDQPVHVRPLISEQSRSGANGKDGSQPNIWVHPSRIPATHKSRTVVRRSNAATALQSSTHGETPFREFANSTLTPEQSRRRATPLLNSKELLRNVRALTPEDQTKFMDKIDQVCRRWLILLSQYLPSIISAKAYPTIDSPDAKFVTALGDLCGATERLPTSVQLSAGLEKRGDVAVASGAYTDIWRGEYYATPVAIKVFRIYPAQNLEEAKEVSIRSASEV